MELGRNNIEDLIGEQVKAIFKSFGRDIAIRGKLVRVEEDVVVILGNRDQQPVIIGKSNLIFLRRDEEMRL